MKRISAIAVLLLITFSLNAQLVTEKHQGMPVSTYSIVAIDTVAGEIGVAVQSHWFAVGSSVPWAQSGVGVVATQSLVDVSYGPLGLDLMQGGKTAQQTLDALTTADKHPDIRQVAMIDVHGNIAAHTGENCIPEAGDIQGANYSVQANLMINDKVWPAMSKAFESTQGDLTDKMLSALQAAQDAGGDIRGRQSAAILVVKTESSGIPWADKLVDLRVEDDPHPVQELKRLVKLHRAYVHMNNGDLALEHNDREAALREYGAAEQMFPNNLEMKFWHAVALVNMGQVDKSIPIFREIFAQDSNWATLLPRLIPVGQLNADQKTVDRILKEAGQDN